MAKYFLDTEFIEDGKTIDLLSIALVCEDGRTYYAISSEADRTKANDWVKANVLPWLSDVDPALWKPRALIAQEIVAFVNAGPAGNPAFWGYYADYDWVALCQLFGPMVDLPLGWPMYCNDLKQLNNSFGELPWPYEPANEHSALDDALWNKEMFDWLTRYP